MKIFFFPLIFNFGGWGLKPFVKPNWQGDLEGEDRNIVTLLKISRTLSLDNPNNYREIALDITTGMAESIKDLQS